MPVSSRLQAIDQRRAELLAEGDTLTRDDAPLEGDELARFEAIAAELDQLADEATRLRAVVAAAQNPAALERVADGLANPRSAAGAGLTVWQRTEDPRPDDVRRLLDGSMPAADLQARAQTVVERTRADRDVLEVVARTIAADDLGGVAAHVLAMSRDEYRSAFDLYLRHGDRAQGLWTDDQRRAVADVERYRAMTIGTDSAGGYATTFEFDPAWVLTGNLTNDPIRNLARVETGSFKTWKGVSTAGVSARWRNGEAEEAVDANPTFAQPSVVAQPADVFLPVSWEAEDDIPGLGQQLARVFAEARQNLEAAAHVTGAAASGAPIGIVTALTGTSSVVASATTDTLAVGDVYNLFGQLPERYRGNARWVANLLTVNAIRQFAPADGHQLIARLADDTPQQMLGRPLVECNAMDGVINATADNYVLIVGDWSNYLIYDRLGFSVRRVDLVGSTNNFPTAQAGYFGFWRTGADSINDGAFRVLNVT